LLSPSWLTCTLWLHEPAKLHAFDPSSHGSDLNRNANLSMSLPVAAVLGKPMEWGSVLVLAVGVLRVPRDLYGWSEVVEAGRWEVPASRVQRAAVLRVEILQCRGRRAAAAARAAHAATLVSAARCMRSLLGCCFSP
jgi:hypothetical protein